MLLLALFVSIKIQSQNIENLVQGYWVQVDYFDHNAKYKVQYSDTVLSGGLLIDNDKINFLNGLYSSRLLYSEVNKKYDENFKAIRKSNYNNITNFFISDSLINIKDNYFNQYISIKVKFISQDSLILVNDKSNFECIYMRKTYESVTKITINSIEYYTSVCMGKCQNYRVKIDKNREFIYEGFHDVMNIGIFEGKIPIEYFKDIWHKIFLINVPMINDHYSTFITDASTVNIKINYDNNKVKEIESYAGAGPSELKWLMNSLYNFENKVKLD